MKNSFILLALIIIISSCNKLKRPKANIVEGRLLSTSIATNPMRTDMDYMVQMDSKGDKYEMNVSQLSYSECQKAMEAKDKNYYIRLKKDKGGLYSISETAQLNYNYGALGVWEFPSDHHIVAHQQ